MWAVYADAKRHARLGCDGLLGWPMPLVEPRYQEQAARLFARLEDLRPRLPHHQPRWFERMLDAAHAFQVGGERPDDDLMLECILVLGELATLSDHADGLDVSDAMAVFDGIGQANGDERERAIEELQTMGRAGRLGSPAAAEHNARSVPRLAILVQRFKGVLPWNWMSCEIWALGPGVDRTGETETHPASRVPVPGHRTNRGQQGPCAEHAHPMLPTLAGDVRGLNQDASFLRDCALSSPPMKTSTEPHGDAECSARDAMELAGPIAAELEAFLRQTFQIPADDPGFSRHVRLWEQGYVDSAGVVETIAHLENRWRIALPEQAFFHPKFTSVAGIAELIAGLLREGRA
jgi:hypothetical protein